MDEHPAGTLGNVATHQQDHDAEHRAQAAREPPAQVGGEEVLVEQDHRQDRAAGGAQPERPVDDQIDPTPDPGGDQLVDGGVDGGVLAPDPGAGEEPADEEVHRVHRERGRDRRDQIHRQRDQKQFLAAHPVGQVAEEQRTQTGPGHIDPGGLPDLGLGDGEAAARLDQPAGDGAHDGDFQPVQDPYRPEPPHDQPVPARPRQPVHPSRDVSGDLLARLSTAIAASHQDATRRTVEVPGVGRWKPCRVSGSVASACSPALPLERSLVVEERQQPASRSRIFSALLCQVEGSGGRSNG